MTNTYTVPSVNAAVNVTCTVTGTTTYTVTLTVNKDGGAFESHGKTFTLRQGVASYTGTGANGTVTFSGVPNGTYDIFDGVTDTGLNVTVNAGAASAALNYYTLNFSVIDDGDASGSTIIATYGGAPVGEETVVLGGKTLFITAIGAGASIYTYSWSGITTGTATDGQYMVGSVNAKVEVTCTVTGTKLYSVSLIVSMDGAALVSGKTFTLRQDGVTKYTGMLMMGGTVLFLDVAKGVYQLYDGNTDTGIQTDVINADVPEVLEYYTISYYVTDKGDAYGSTITATYNGSPIISGTKVIGGKELVITVMGEGATVYEYVWSGSASGTSASYTTTVNDGVNAICTVTGTKLYSVSITVNLDGTTLAPGKTFTLRKDGVTMYTGTAVDGIISFTNVVNDVYQLFDGETDTGLTVTADGTSSNPDLKYFTIRYSVVDAGMASGSKISATYGGAAINSGTVVIGGKQLIVTVTAAGAPAYTYAWSGMAYGTTNQYTLNSVNATVNVTCTVTGTEAGGGGGGFPVMIIVGIIAAVAAAGAAVWFFLLRKR
ncbi:MAG: hypothetical protein LBV13_03365 [Methanomassiliicoccaceae archaeon]|jgi:hypothetical protein|nr:hypothetical protein [Methanomassiliicoccaceae archaeon]